jgi:hypothetical protein
VKCVQNFNWKTTSEEKKLKDIGVDGRSVFKSILRK